MRQSSAWYMELIPRLPCTLVSFLSLELSNWLLFRDRVERFDSAMSGIPCPSWESVIHSCLFHLGFYDTTPATAQQWAREPFCLPNLCEKAISQSVWGFKWNNMGHFIIQALRYYRNKRFSSCLLFEGKREGQERNLESTLSQSSVYSTKPVK